MTSILPRYVSPARSLGANLPTARMPSSALARSALEARRTRSGAALSRRSLSGFGSLGATGGAQPATWQVDPTALRQLIAVAQKSQSPTATAAPSVAAPAPVAAAQPPSNLAATVAALRSGFKGLGLSPESGAVTGKIASTAGGAAVTSAAAAGTFGTAISAGSIAGPIGIAAGVVIALAISLFTKQYFNVNQSNQLCSQLEPLWQKYTSIQGYVAGRALGWQSMNQLMHAATGAGLFPGNDMHLSFHEGTLQCAGHGDWVDAFTGYTAQGNASGGSGCSGNNCMADALKNFSHNAVPPGTPDAVYFVDSILLPMNDPSHAKIPWIYNGASQNPQVHQLLYDMADAYLAQFSSGTVPYVEYPQSQVGTPTAGAQASPTGAATVYAAPAASAPAQPASAPAGIPAGWTQVGTDPVTGVPIVAQSGNAQEYEVVNGQLTPYNPTQATTVPVASAQGVIPAGTPTTGGLDPTTAALIQQMMAQGASQQQAYTAALSQLQSQGVNTASPAVQSQVAQAVQAPAGTTGAMTTGGALGGMSTSTVLLIAGGLGVAFIMAYMGEKGRKAAAKGEKKS